MHKVLRATLLEEINLLSRVLKIPFLHLLESFSLLTTLSVPDFSLQVTKLSSSQQMILPPTLLKKYSPLPSIHLKFSLFSLVSEEMFVLFLPHFQWVFHPEIVPQSCQKPQIPFFFFCHEMNVPQESSLSPAHSLSLITSHPSHRAFQLGIFLPLPAHLFEACLYLPIQIPCNSSLTGSQQPPPLPITSLRDSLLRPPLPYLPVALSLLVTSSSSLSSLNIDTSWVLLAKNFSLHIFNNFSCSRGFNSSLKET